MPQTSLARCASREGILDTLVQLVNFYDLSDEVVLVLQRGQTYPTSNRSLENDPFGFGRGFRYCTSPALDNAFVIANTSKVEIKYPLSDRLSNGI